MHGKATTSIVSKEEDFKTLNIDVEKRLVELNGVRINKPYTKVVVTLLPNDWSVDLFAEENKD